VAEQEERVAVGVVAAARGDLGVEVGPERVRERLEEQLEGSGARRQLR
jgi:pyruvate kinase